MKWNLVRAVQLLNKRKSLQKQKGWPKKKQRKLNKNLFNAARTSTLNEVKKLVEDGADVHWKNDRCYHCIALHNACASPQNNGEIVRYLLEQHSDVNARNDDGNTPLIWAAVNGNVEAVNILLDFKANIDLKDYKQMRTALHDAVKKEQIEVVRILLEHGANYNATDKKGRTPHDIISGNSSTLIGMFKPYLDDKNGKHMKEEFVQKRKRTDTDDTDSDSDSVDDSKKHLNSKGNSDDDDDEEKESDSKSRLKKRKEERPHKRRNTEQKSLANGQNEIVKNEPGNKMVVDEKIYNKRGRPRSDEKDIKITKKTEKADKTKEKEEKIIKEEKKSKSKSNEKDTIEDTEDEELELGDDEFIVERVVGMKVSKGGKVHYLVKWKGWDTKDNSWVAQNDLNAPELIDEYVVKKQKTK